MTTAAIIYCVVALLLIVVLFAWLYTWPPRQKPARQCGIPGMCCVCGCVESEPLTCPDGEEHCYHWDSWRSNED
jgi:hypothetical protein